MELCIDCGKEPDDPIRPYPGLGPVCRACFCRADQASEALELAIAVRLAPPELEAELLEAASPEPVEAPPARVLARRAPPRPPPAWRPPADWTPSRRRAAEALFARGFTVDELGRVARCG